MPSQDPARPDPDALLALARREQRGALKVFLGAAPGVGKTFEMLNDARRRLAAGADVLVGIVETHGRADTAAQIGELPVLGRQRIDYRGQVIEEFDLDAALARRPKILLLDELAHTNAPGSRHPKRWQDAEELRDAGIEVWTTMNVQHLESLSDPVARITGVRVAETVPDSVLAGADAVVLIDIPPAELLERMRQGKVYRPDQADRALRGFFREGNLAALRELALRRTAERVDADVSGYMRANAIPGPWPSGARVLALVGADDSAEAVVRAARSIADALRGRLLAVHVEVPGSDGDVALAAAGLRLAESLGAQVETLVDAHVPRAILAHARGHNVTHLVMGRARPSLLRRLAGRTLAGVLLRKASDFTLHLVPDSLSRPKPAALPSGLPRALRWVAPPALVGFASLVGELLDDTIPDASMGMLYLVATVAAAVGFGPAAGVFAAVLSFPAWNYLFLPPRYTLAIAAAQDLVGAVVFALLALLLAFTTGGLGGSVRAARARVVALRRLVEFSRRLGAAQSGGALAIEVADQAGRITGVPACVLTPLPPVRPGGEPDLVLRAAAPRDAEPDMTGMAAARWALAHGRPTGRATDTLPAGTPWQFRPIGQPAAPIALLGIRLADDLAAPPPELDQALTALLDQAGIAMERMQLMEESARSVARAETDALRSALLTSLGHDLRTPLTSIRGALETLRTAGASLDQARRDDLLATAEEETDRLTRYLANILEIVRIEHGQVTPSRQPTDIAEAVETAIARAERASARAIQWAASPGLKPASLDPVLLDQILANLIENALKFSGAGGTVRVSATAEVGEVAIAVEDDGPGIPRDDIPRIFVPFFRADRAGSGTGLGLAICRGLTHAMGGRIAAESPLTPDGRGTRITVRFVA